MKPVFAARSTKCNSCGEVIVPGSRRVDDVMRNPKDGAPIPFLRLHYHLHCYIKKLEHWFETHEQEKTQGRGGRPPTLDLTAPQKLERRKVLARLSALTDYYLPRLNIQATDITQMSALDLRRFQTFYLQRTRHLNALKSLGGIPEKYQNVVNPNLADLLPPVERMTAEGEDMGDPLEIDISDILSEEVAIE